jgi:hypothetical protein
MFYFYRKLVAVLLAIWLPLFSANALAVSVAMQSMGGECHVAQLNVLQPITHHSYHAFTMHQHLQHADHLAQQEQHDNQNDQHSASHKDCGVCQLACCGFMATVAFEVAEIIPAAQLYSLSSTQFQSFYSVPLVPPPLARA